MFCLAQVAHFPYPEVALKVAMSGGVGLLVGLEREWAKKEIGVRTFALSGLLGMLTSLIAPTHVIAALMGILLLVTFLNVHSLLKDRSLELTTSLCLIIVFFLGSLVGLGHTFTAATAAIAMMMLLAWKFELERFAGALKPDEIRSAVLLGLLSVVIYPLLPNRFVDPWQLLNPRQYWVTVMAIAGIGFLNYALLRIYGNRGMYYAAVLGGLVNSTAAVAEISASLRSERVDTATRSSDTSRSVAILILTDVAMFARNVIILAIFAPKAVRHAAPPLLTMMLLAAMLVLLQHRRDGSAPSPLRLSSPVSLRRVGKFALIFLALAFAGTLAQRFFGNYGFLAVSILGGLVSSASTTATAATLAAAGKISPELAGVGTILTSLSSAIVNLPLVHQQARQRLLTIRLSIATALLTCAGIFTLFVQRWIHG
jgi:uncharacterized membrane protein (DUF4010 family)